jgi:hypothetical protein
MNSEFLSRIKVYNMESPDGLMEKKLAVKDMRNEIKGMKEKLFQNTAVMRQGDLRAYLDKLRYVENAINAENAMGGNEKKYLKEEHKELDSKKKDKKEKVPESESESDSSDDEKPVKEKVKKEIKMIEKGMKAEMKSPSKEKTVKLHKDEMKHLKALEKELSTIPKPMHSSYKKHLKMAGGDHEKARKMLKKEMKI